MIQGSQEWFETKKGNVGASRIADIMATTKSGESASRLNYLTELVVERLGGANDKFTSAAMEYGTEMEPFARAAYEAHKLVLVDQTGFIMHPTIARSGASPDGLVGTDGLVEIKCPNTATHINYLLTRSIPQRYQLQMLWQMACTGREWCDFVSYDPRLPGNLSLFVIEFERDDKRIKEIEAEVVRFLDEVEETIAKLRKLAA